MARPVDHAAPGDRIAKLLARAGVASRREVERMIGEGRVARDGVPIDTPATVLTSLAGVTVDGEPVAAAAPARLFLYHKPPGLLVTERDPRGRPTIYDRLAQGYDGDLPRVVPVGRLDLNTEGLLLLTTDGGLKRQLELPATGVERTYRARAYGAVTQAALEALSEGIEIDGFRYGPIDANLERRTGANSWIELRLAEGKNREVRRVLEHLGLEVSRLIRIAYGPFVLGDLPPGAVGEVRERDLVGFRAALGKGGSRMPDIAPAPVSPTRSNRHSPASIKLHPGAGRGPGGIRPGLKGDASPQQSVPQRAPARRPSAPSAPQLGSGLRRGGAKIEAAKQAPPASRQAAADAELPPRPAKLQRKPGWAKPKPKPGARPPKKR